MARVELPDFLVIAEAHAGIPAEQLARIPRVVNLASAALAAPFAGFADVELFPTFAAKASIYLCRIATYHPLPDGNKRTAYDVTVEFIERNGHTFTHESLDDTGAMIERIAARDIDESEVIDWMGLRIVY